VILLALALLPQLECQLVLLSCFFSVSVPHFLSRSPQDFEAIHRGVRHQCFLASAVMLASESQPAKTAIRDPRLLLIRYRLSLFAPRTFEVPPRSL
jgi:hypothetical protein